MTQARTDPQSRVDKLGRSWKLAFLLGLLTALLGIVVAADPGTSLVVLAVLIGVELVASGLFWLVRSLADGAAHDRVLGAVVGVVLLIVGLFLIRHLDVTLLLVSALVGVFWIAAGVAEVAAGLAAPAHGGWLLVIGLLGTLAGIFVLAFPVGTLLTLALVVGIWLIVRGVAQMAAALGTRRGDPTPS